MSDHFDRLETRDPAVRERAQWAQLPRQIAHAKAHAPAFARILANIDPYAITTREALARIPVTRKSELLELQKTDRLAGKLRTLSMCLVSSEAFLSRLRDTLAARGIVGYQVYASADVGAIAYETPAREGLVVDEGVLVEIVRPGTGDTVAAGDV